MTKQEQCVLCGQIATHHVWDKDDTPQPVCGEDDCYCPIKGANSCHQMFLAANEAKHY